VNWLNHRVSIEGSFLGSPGRFFYGDTVTFECGSPSSTDTRTIVWEASARNEDSLEVLRPRDPEISAQKVS